MEFITKFLEVLWMTDVSMWLIYILLGSAFVSIFVGMNAFVVIIMVICVGLLSLIGMLYLLNMLIFATQLLVPIVFHFIIKPFYLFYDIPYMPITSFHMIANIFWLLIILGCVAAYYCLFWFNKKTKIIGTIILFSCFILTGANFINFYTDKVNSMEEFLYVYTLNKFKDTRFMSIAQDEGHYENIRSTPFYKKIEAEIEKPTLDKDLIKEINLFNEYRSSIRDDYFLSMKKEDEFRMRYGFSNNQKQKIHFAKIIADGYISVVEKYQFEKKWK